MESKVDRITDAYHSAIAQAKAKGFFVFPASMENESFDCKVSWRDDELNSIDQFLDFGKIHGQKHLLVETVMLDQDDITAALHDADEIADEYDVSLLKKRINLCKAYDGEVALFCMSFHIGNALYEYKLYPEWYGYVFADAEEMAEELETEKPVKVIYDKAMKQEYAVKLAEDKEFQEYGTKWLKQKHGRQFYARERRDIRFPIEEIIEKAIVHYKTKILAAEEKSLAVALKKGLAEGRRLDEISIELEVPLAKLRSIKTRYL